MQNKRFWRRLPRNQKPGTKDKSQQALVCSQSFDVEGYASCLGLYRLVRANGNDATGPLIHPETLFTLFDPEIPWVGMPALAHPSRSTPPAVDGQPHIPAC